MHVTVVKKQRYWKKRKLYKVLKNDLVILIYSGFNFYHRIFAAF